MKHTALKAFKAWQKLILSRQVGAENSSSYSFRRLNKRFWGSLDCQENCSLILEDGQLGYKFISRWQSIFPLAKWGIWVAPSLAEQAQWKSQWLEEQRLFHEENKRGRMEEEGFLLAERFSV